MIPTQEAPASVDIRLENFPEFAGNGTKTPPTDAKRALGYVPSDTFPAEQANWLFNKSSKGVSRGNMGILAMEKELNTIITENGGSPDQTKDNQVYQAIDGMVTTMGNTKAPTNHASANNTYGLGSSSNYGHVKISDTYSSEVSGDGIAASQKALHDVYAAAIAAGGAPLTNLPPEGLGQTAAAGSGMEAARSDHVHPVPQLERTLRCTTALGTAKEITVSNFFFETGTTVDVFFTHGYYVATSSGVFTLNVNNLGAKSIFVVRNGEIIAMPNHLCTRTESGDSTAHYWVIQQNTLLKLMYDETLDDNRGGWLVLGNPIVLSSSSANESYTVYADGYHREDHTITNPASVEQTLVFDIPYVNIPSFVGTIHYNGWSGVAEARFGYDATTTSLKYQGNASFIFAFFISGY